jgi:solute carrier family 8 (sodium/calcium exchanger)
VPSAHRPRGGAACTAGEGRLIKERTVFAITATFSIGAYLWLLVILVGITPNVVDPWEVGYDCFDFA